jgi:hypothetical protein
MGSGANNTARYLGSATGLTVSALLITHAGTGAGTAGLLSGWNAATLVSVAFSLLGALAVLLAQGGDPTEHTTIVHRQEMQSCVQRSCTRQVTSGSRPSLTPV